MPLVAAQPGSRSDLQEALPAGTLGETMPGEGGT